MLVAPTTLVANTSSDDLARVRGQATSWRSPEIAITDRDLSDDALRDLIVMLRLQQGVWRDGGPQWVTAEVAARYYDGLVQAERQLLVLANRVMPASAIRELQDMTDEWLASNPE